MLNRFFSKRVFSLGVLTLAMAVFAEPPVTLAGAIRESMSKSEEALILQEKRKKFAAIKQDAWSGGLPQITANASAGRGAVTFDPSSVGFKDTTNPNKILNITQDRYVWDVEVQQSIFSFGRLGQAIHVAGIQERADDASRKRALQQLQLTVLDAYYAVVNSRARLQTLEASVKRAHETQAFLESNFKMGSGVRSNVLRALTALKALEPERIRAGRDAQAATMALNRILGRDVDAPLELDTTVHLDFPVMAAAPDSQTIHSVLEDRSDLKSLELNKQSLMGQAKYLRMQYLPALGAQAKYGITAYELSQLGDIKNNHEWQIGVGLRWPLFDGFSFSAKAKQIESEARSLDLTARQMRKFTQVEIESAYREYQAADSAQVAAEQAVSAAQEAQAMMSEEFRAGKGVLTDLLGVEQSLREASLGVLGARYASVRSKAALRLALGKDLINEEAP